MKKFYLFRESFDFDTFVEAVNLMATDHSVFAHIVKDDNDCYVSDEPTEGSIKVEFYYCDRLWWNLLDMKIRVERGKAIA